MKRVYGFPAYLQTGVEKALASYGLTLEDSKTLAESVLKLSDYFINSPAGQTPWKEKWAQIAYLCYYLPLNSVRLQGILDQTDTLGFWKDLDHVFDFGAGLATASQVLSQKKPLQFHLIEQSTEPERLIRSFFGNFQAADWSANIKSSMVREPSKSVALFSYSLTELDTLPDWAFQCEALFIVEPSTSEDGRKLLQLREKLLQRGFYAWGPCTHQMACPLLTQSKHDWCHDRVHFEAPPWFLKMEQLLPMRNRTLTMSYLMMRKTPPPALPATARVVGDQLIEKGKNRQLICRGPEREFLSWLHKEKIEQEIPRGVLIKIPEELQKVANELRVKKEIQIL